MLPTDPEVLARVSAAMELALEEAARATDHDDVPVGAVLLGADGSVLARAHNERELRRDPTAHAEVLALRAAAGRLGTWRLDGTTMVVTLEPCAMCAGALLAARVATVAWGAADPKGGACGSLYHLGTDPRLNHEFETIPWIEEERCAAVLTGFFAARL